MNIKRISAVVMSAAMIGTSLPFGDIAVNFANKNIITANAEEGYATNAYPETNEPSSDYYEYATTAETEPWTDAYENSAEYATRYTEKTASTTIISGTTPLTGKCGDNISYTFVETGVIVISGTGEMEDYDNNSSPFYNNGSIKKVIVSDGITSIGEYAFSGCGGLENIIIPDTITSIGAYAFKDCQSFTEIKIPEHVDSIGKGAFKDCKNLKSINLPDSLLEINPYIFYNCASLENIIIPNTITSIDSYSFYLCTSLTEISISDTITSIGEYATYGCRNLKDVYYSGTKSDWDKVSVGTYNGGILIATIHFLREDPTTSLSTEPTTSETTGTEVEFEIGNISATAGDGYGEEGSDTEWSAILPIKVNNDTGIAGINGRLNMSSDLAKVFQLEEISLKNDDDGTKGPYTGTFTYETKYWSFSIASSGYRNWEKQPDKTPFVYYYVKVTKDKSLIARVADGMGIELDSDENGSYYKFPIEWYTSDSEANIVSDINLLETKPSLKNGSIKVYVNSEKVTTEPATTTTEPVATTGYKSTTKITTTQVPFSVSPKTTTIKVGDTFTITVNATDNPSVKYTVNPSNVVVVDAKGKVSGINPGETSILVYTEDGRSDTLKVTVLPAGSVSDVTTPTGTKNTNTPLVVEPKTIEIFVNDTFKINASGGDGNYTYISMDDKIVEVGANGTVLGLNPGTAIVKVKDGLGDLETVKVIVKPLETTAATVASGVTTATTPKVTYAELVVTPKEITIDVNEDAKISVTGGDGNYTFKSNDDSIAEVGSNGAVIGIKPGKTVIIVTDGAGNKASVNVTVNKLAETTAATTGDTPVVTTTKVTYADLIVAPDVIQLKPNESEKITVSGGYGKYTITSKDPEIAEAGNNGIVTGYKPGETVIKVTDDAGNMVTVKVIVLQPETTAAATTMTTTRVTTTITTTTPIILTDATETTRQTYAPLEASPDEITITEGERATITVTGGDGDYKFVVSDEDYAIVSSYGTVLGLKSGVAVVTVIDGEGNTDTVYVYVTAKTYATTTETTYRTTARTTTRSTYRTWSTDPWEETTYSQASEEASRATEISWEATTDSWATTDPWATEPSTILGDVNADYKVDSKDAVLVLKYYAAELVNADSTVAIIPSAADVNDDGKINSKDAISILRYYVNELSGINVGGMREFVSSDIPETTEYVVPETTNESDVDHNYKGMEINVGTVTVKPGTKTVNVPVILSGNKGFAGGGFIFDFDLNLSFDGAEGGIISTLATSVNNNLLSVTFAGHQNITSNGVMFTLQFELPENAKSGDVYNVYINDVDTFCDEYRNSFSFGYRPTGAIKVEDGEYETTEPATTARPIYSTTRKTTAISYNSGISTATKNITFSIGNVSAKSGDGYGEDGTNEKWSVSLPIKVNNDCGIAGINASIDIDDDLKKIFQLESISLSDDGYSGPYSGTFITSIDKWRFALSNTANGNWRVQPDGTPFVWYNIKVTEDKSLIEKVAVNKGIKLNNDSTGSYYEFTLSLNEDGKVVDTSAMKVEPYFESGSIKVYVNIYSETTSSTNPWEETTYPQASEETTEAFYVTPENMTLKPGEKSNIYKSVLGSCEFTSADELIVTVDDDGSVTAVSPGTTYITVKNNKGQTAIVSVTVTAPATTAASTTVATKKPVVTDPPANKDSLKVDVNNVELEVGKKFNIKANQNDLTYATSNSNIAIVSKSGEITAISAGTVVITVINPDKETDSITVTVKNPVTPPTKSDIILGDVNVDGKVDSKDAVLVLKDYAQVLTGSKSSIAPERGDINSDGKIDSKDAVKILKYYANKMVRNDADIDIRNV